MRRRRLVVAMAAMCGLPQVLHAQPRNRVRRVGYLSVAAREYDANWLQAFRDRLREFGYAEGKNLELHVRHSSQKPERLSELAADLVKHRVEVLVVYGTPALAVVRELDVPIVMTVHADPLGTGVVKSLARPGGNITGLTDGHADLAPKRLELLKEVAPSIKRVAVLFNPETPHAVRQLKHVQTAGPRLDVAVSPIEVHGPKDIDGALAGVLRARADALFVAPDPSWWIGQHQRLADFAIENRMPTIGTVREFAERGMLVAYGTSFVELWRRSAAYVDKILKGARPGDLPIEQATKFDLIVNLRTARAIGLTVPRAIVLRADHVIE